MSELESQSIPPNSTKVVKITNTPVDVLQEIKNAWKTLYGENQEKKDIENKIIAMLAAQCALETGRGKDIYNYNFGGIIGSPGNVVFKSYKDGTSKYFKSYNSKEEGAQDYVSLLKNKYPNAIKAAESGNYNKFVDGLSGYFTDDKSIYKQNIFGLYFEYMSKLKQSQNANLDLIKSQDIKTSSLKHVQKMNIYNKILNAGKYHGSPVPKNAREVPTKKTPMSFNEAMSSLKSAWMSVMGSEPSQRTICILIAQWALETGRGKYMMNFNFGGIKPGSSYSGLVTPYRTTEGYGATKEYITDYFRAYNSAEDGAKDYISFLKRNYSDALAAAKQEDPEKFVHALKSHGYFTGSESEYTSAVKSIANEAFSKKFENLPSSPSTTPTPKEEGFLEKAKRYLESLFHSKQKQDSSQPTQSKPEDNGIISTLDKLLKIIKGNEKHNMVLYNKLLPQNNILIKISSKDYTDSLEFANLLCSVFDEELLSRSNIYTDNSNIEVFCSIPGPQKECINIVKDFTNCLKSSFKKATNKIGSIDIETNFTLNKTPSYKEINFKQAEIQRRKFLLKFI